MPKMIADNSDGKSHRFMRTQLIIFWHINVRLTCQVVAAAPPMAFDIKVPKATAATPLSQCTHV